MNDHVTGWASGCSANFLHKHKGLSLDLPEPSHVKKLGMAAHTANPQAEEADMGGSLGKAG